MLDVSRWLAEQGLGHHAEAFAQNGIAGDVLYDLTDADLKELGLNLGDRKRLLKAMAALDTGSTEGRVEAVKPTPAVPREAERRQLTVLFSDLVGSTALAAKLDPEDLSALIRAYHASCTEAIKRWDGHVAKYMGDAVLVYFGWPVAHEDEAERAVRAGLAITAGVATLPSPGGVPLATRIGIATGSVVVGELIGEGVAQEQSVAGETPNLAARLQSLAAPDSVVISQATRRLLGGMFNLTDLGPVRLRGSVLNPPLADRRGEHRTEPVPPEPHRLVTDIDPTFEQQILDLPQRQGIADVHQHRETDHLGRAVEIAERIAHHQRLRIVPAGLKPICSDRPIASNQTAARASHCRDYSRNAPPCWRSADPAGGSREPRLSKNVWCPSKSVRHFIQSATVASYKPAGGLP